MTKAAQEMVDGKAGYREIKLKAKLLRVLQAFCAYSGTGPHDGRNGMECWNHHARE